MCFLCEFSRFRSGTVLRENTQKQLFWCCVHRNRHHVMQVHIEWTELGQMFEDFSQQIAHKWFMARITCRLITAHVLERKKKKSQESQSARGQIMKRQRGKKSSNKYETANYSLSSVGNNQFYGSGSLWSRRQLYEEWLIQCLILQFWKGFNI